MVKQAEKKAAAKDKREAALPIGSISDSISALTPDSTVASTLAQSLLITPSVTLLVCSLATLLAQLLALPST